MMYCSYFRKKVQIVSIAKPIPFSVTERGKRPWPVDGGLDGQGL
jgi:hypothetical protein